MKRVLVLFGCLSAPIALAQSVEQAIPASVFTDSVGVNVHLDYGDTVYVNQFPRIEQAFLDLGIKHYRSGVADGTIAYQTNWDHAEELASHGIKANWLIDANASTDTINAIVAKAPHALFSYEAVNEADWEIGWRLTSDVQRLHDAVKGNPATAWAPIIAPSLMYQSSYAAQGDMSGLVDLGNIHDYYSYRPPETPSYGGQFYNCGWYGSMGSLICLAEMEAQKSVVATECGYQSGYLLSDEVISRYEVRLLFEHIREGVGHTYLYELVDENGINFGLLRNDLSPKPVYRAIKSVMDVLQDQPFPSPGQLDFQVTGQTQNVEHMLFQKSDGTFVIAIWQAVRAVDPDTGAENDPAPQDVTIALNTPVSQGTIYQLDDQGNETPVALNGINGSVNLQVTDRVTLVALR